MIQRVGSYEVVRELARGGMGIVYAARDPALDRDVAIKVVSPGALDPDGLERFRREGRAAARLRHPNIVGVYSLGALPGGQPYLVMDLIEGESMRARVAREGPFVPAEAARLIAVVARALEYAHERGVLHRDLKPANVLLDDQGAPHLTDFGLALLVDRVTRMTATGEVMGTPVYMAPEQANGDKARVGPASDVYGLGATLYELLTGRTPFQGLAGLAALQAVLERAPDPPSALRPGLDRALEAICLRCLEKDPAARFPSAAALAQALEDWGGVGVADRVQGRRRRSARPWVTVVLGAGLAGASAGWAHAERARAGAVAATALAVEAAARDAVRARDDAVAVVRQAERARAETLAATRRTSPAAEAALTLALNLPGHDDAGRNELQARRAAARLRLEQHDLARADFEAVLSRDPRHPLARALAIGSRMVALGSQPADAALTRELDELIAQAPALAQAYQLRGLLRLSRGDPAGARADADQALSLDPTLVAALRLRAKLRGQRSSDARGALDDAVVATHLEPDTAGNWRMLYLCAMEVGEHERARGAAERALALQDEPEMRRQLDHLRTLEGDPDELRPITAREAIELARRGAPRRAERALTRALAQGPELDLDLLAWRALLRIELDQLELASVDCELVLRARPEHPLAQLVRASLLRRVGAPGPAKQMVAGLLDRGHQLPEAYALVALILADDGDRAGARGAIARAKALDPGFGRGEAILAGLLLAEGDLAGGAAAAERAVELAPLHSRSLAMAARARLLAGDLDGADAAASRCLQLREDPDALFVRGKVAAARDDLAAGLAWTERALELRPVDATFHVSRVELLLAMGEREEATRAADQGIMWLGPNAQAARQLRDLQARARGR